MTDPFTKLPNWIMDGVMPNEPYPVLLIVLVVARKTIGYQKESDKISISQFMESSGLSRPTVIKAKKTAIENGYIMKVNGRYLLVKQIDPASKGALPEANELYPPASKGALPKKVNELYPPSKGALPKKVNELYPQKKKETIKRNTLKKGVISPAQQLHQFYCDATCRFINVSTPLGQRSIQAGIEILKAYGDDLEAAKTAVIDCIAKFNTDGLNHKSLSSLQKTVVRDAAPIYTERDDEIFNEWWDTIMRRKANELSEPMRFILRKIAPIGGEGHGCPQALRESRESDIPMYKEKFFIQYNLLRSEGRI